ncbi:MAG: flagellar protein FlgN [Tissierellia bacterium]|nr:flagellar protein FlgN [Tissierellia bacterium]
MTKERIDELISISEEKNRLLFEMQEITKRQREEIKEEDMEKLNEILDKKNNIIKKIDRLDTSFLSIFSQIKRDEKVQDIDELDIKRYSNLRELKKIVKEVSSTLIAISLIDEENNNFMKEKLEETKMEIRKIKDGKKAYKGYNTTIIGSILIDEKK